MPDRKNHWAEAASPSLEPARRAMSVGVVTTGTGIRTG